MANRIQKKQDAINKMLDGIDFHGMSAEEITAQDGL